MSDGVMVAAVERRLQPLVHTVQAFVRCILRAERRADWGVEVFLVSDRVMRTDVLAYEASRMVPRPDWGDKFLGELYVNPDAIRARGGRLTALLAHGMLHLMGYRHERRHDILRMRSHEARLANVCSTSSD